MHDNKKLSFLKSIASPVLKILKKEMRHIELKSGEILFKEGDEGNGLYIVTSGRLRAYKENPGGINNTIGEIGKDESVGELALIKNDKRSLSVMAIRDSKLAFLSRQAFESIIKKHPGMMVDICRTIIDRYQRMLHNHNGSNPVHTIAIINVSNQEVATQFQEKLLAAFKEQYNPILLNEMSVNDYIASHSKKSLFRSDNGTTDVCNYLNNLESENDILLYITNKTPDAWSAKCLRQADRVIVLAQSIDKDQIAEIKNRLSGFKEVSDLAKWDLVIIHPENTIIPSGTNKWLETGLFERWFHIKLSNDENFRSLVRWYTGNAVGLVLSGGGARGFAHIGVIKALKEKNIPIDAIGGVSMGSVIAGEMAYGCDYNTMIAWNTDVCINQNILGDFTLPLISLASGKRLSRSISKYFGDTLIEDLWTPYFCLSCNITRATEHIHNTGVLWEAVRTSVSIPGIASPVIKNGELYVDGGVINNLPSDVMSRKGVGKVIAIDVASSETVATNHPDTDSVCPFKVLAGKYIYDKNYDVPGLASILLRSGTIGSVFAEEKSREYADYYFKIPLSEYGMLDWQKSLDIARIGYEATLVQVDGSDLPGN